MINYSIQYRGVVNYRGLHNHRRGFIYEAKRGFTHPSPYTDDLQKCFTGNFGHLVCCSCNTGIGLLKDNVDVLKNAIKYLENLNANNEKGGKT